MDTSALARTTPLAPVMGLGRAQLVQNGADLPAPAAVTPAVDVSLSPDVATQRRPDGDRSQDTQNERERAFVDDPNSRDLVFRVSDGSSGSVVYQIPSEEILKLRVYAQSADKARAERGPERDIEA
jgi:hypothetical protein